MSLFDCLETAIGAKEISEDRARVAQDLYTELLNRYRRQMGESEAQMRAGADTKKIMREKVESRRRALAAQVIAARRIDQTFDAHTDFKGRNDMADAVPQLLKNRGWFKGESWDGVHHAIRRSLFRNLDQFVQKHSKDILGRTRSKADLDKVRLEMEGQRTGDPVSAAFARALQDSFEQARRMFNAAGGHIQKLENWAPQVWNRRALQQMPEQQWIDDMLEAVDWNRVYDPLTGRPFESADNPKVVDFLREARQSIVSEGWNKVDPSFAVKGKAMYNRRADHRVLHFKPGKWSEIAEKYGSPDVFDASVAYLNSMARDIALMRVLGPNPAAGLEFAAQKALKQANNNLSPIRQGRFRGPVSHAQTQVNRAKNMLALANGTAQTPVNEFWASFFAGTRDSLSAAYLGSAMVSSVTDFATMGFASRFVGMSSSRVMGRYLQTMTSSAGKEDLQRVLGVLDTALNTSAAMARFSNDVISPEITRRLSMGVIRGQGLAHHTDIGRSAFQLEFMGLLAEHSGKSFRDLPEPLRNLFRGRGITVDDWNRIRETQLFEGRTGRFLIPDDIRHRTDMSQQEAEGLAIRLQSLIEDQTEFAIPSGDLEGKAIFLSDRPGTFWGEVSRSGMMFKNFGVSVMMGQVRRVMAMGTVWDKTTYAASFITAVTLLGAMTLQVKEMIKGRDPMPMDTPTFWGRAIVQGGGFGIFGDFFASGTSRYGDGFAGTLAGPLVGFGQDAFDVTFGNVAQAARGENTNVGRDVSNFVRFNLPGSSLWYLRPVLERMVFDQMQQILDPDAADHFRRQAQNQRRVRGTRNFWERGDVLPERAPDLNRALGQ